MSARAQSRDADLSVVLKIAFVCVATASVTLVGLALGHGNPSASKAGAAESSREIVAPALPQLACASGLIGSGDIDVIGPSTAAEAKVWPQTPAEAVRSLKMSVLAPAAASRGELTIGEGSTVISGDGGAAASEYTVTDAAGDAVVRVRVEDIGFGAYAVTQIERCSE